MQEYKLETDELQVKESPAADLSPAFAQLSLVENAYQAEVANHIIDILHDSNSVVVAGRKNVGKSATISLVTASVLIMCTVIPAMVQRLFSP